MMQHNVYLVIIILLFSAAKLIHNADDRVSFHGVHLVENLCDIISQLTELL